MTAQPAAPRGLRDRVGGPVFFWLAVPSAVLGSGFLLDRLLGLATLRVWPLRLGLGCALVVAGGALIAAAIRDLRRLGHGTPNPRRPPEELVTGGSYRYCRHPMAFGYDVAALGVVLLVGSPSALLVSLPAWYAVQAWALACEERRLALRFGAAFESYRSRVPFLVPWPAGRKEQP